MSETLLTKSKRKTAADYELVAVQLLDEISRLEEQMDRDRAESERLRVETQIIKAHSAAASNGPRAMRLNHSRAQAKAPIECSRIFNTRCRTWSGLYGAAPRWNRPFQNYARSRKERTM